MKIVIHFHHGEGCYTRLCDTDEEAVDILAGTTIALLADRDEREAKIARERDEARAERDAMANVLPGVYYMDPPDGGDVPVLEQLRRMAKDAERYRFLSCKGVPPYFHRCSRWRLEYWNGEWWDPLMKEELDAAIDAQIEKEERP